MAHAISVQRVDFDSDYFTAVDDVKQDSDEEGDAGAAMIGDVEFNSAHVLPVRQRGCGQAAGYAR